MFSYKYVGGICMIKRIKLNFVLFNSFCIRKKKKIMMNENNI